MCSHMAAVPALRDNSGIGPYCAICIHLMHAVGLIVVLALFALEAGIQLRTEAHALAGFHQRDFGPDSQGLANDLVADGQREVLVAPAAADGVHIGAADPAGLDLDLDIIVFEWLGRDLERGVNGSFSQ